MLNTFDFGLLVAIGVIFVAGIWIKARRFSIGAPVGATGKVSDRFFSTLRELVWHKRILGDAPQGRHHYMLFAAFTLPILVVVLVNFGLRLPSVPAVLLSFTLEAVAVMGVYGTTQLMLRRYRQKPEELDNKVGDVLPYLLLYGIFITGFLTEGARISASTSASDLITPVGFVLSVPFNFMGGHATATFVSFIWRMHLFLVLATVALLPYGKMAHILFGSANIFLANKGPKGAFALLDIDNAETFGVGQIEQFTKKQLLDLEACVRCGRCQVRCPANATGKTLNPKKVIQDLRAHLYANYSKVKAGMGDALEDPMLDGSGVSESDVWACTTCRHCMEACPMRVEHVDKIVDMRRYMVLMEGRMPQELVTLNKNMENNFNPWGVGYTERNDWMKRRKVSPRILTEEEDPKFDVLLWVGCAGAYDDRYQRVAASVCRILERADISYGVLGEAEKCCGDPARASGNEYLYQSLAAENIETMKALGVKKILTTCPHCMKAIDVDYAQMGGDFEVVHHATFLKELVESGRIHLSRDMPQTVTLHDSCYLSRYKGVTAEPRTLLASVGGLELREMERSREENFCCGGGGARMWMEEEGERIGNVRAIEAVETGADTICSECPFCMTMLSDGLKAAKMEEEKSVLDLAEIIERAMV